MFARTTRLLTLGALAFAPMLSLADPYQVTVTSTVYDLAKLPTFNIQNFLKVGDAATFTFMVDSNSFIDSSAHPVRGYTITPGSMSLTVGGYSVALTVPSPMYFSIRNNDPGVDGVFVGTTEAGWSAMDAVFPGSNVPLSFGFLETWTGGQQWSSTDIAGLAGQSFGTNKISVFAFELATPGGTGVVSFNVPTMTVSAVPEPATFGLMALGGLGLLAFARRRQQA